MDDPLVIHSFVSMPGQCDVSEVLDPASASPKCTEYIWSRRLLNRMTGLNGIPAGGLAQDVSGRRSNGSHRAVAAMSASRETRKTTSTIES